MDQVLVRARIVICGFFWGMGNVELDLPAGLQVHEERPSPRAENVAWVRLAVQQLLARAPAVGEGRSAC